MDFIDVNYERSLPVFLGVLGALVCCGLLAAKGPVSFAFFVKEAEELVIIEAPDDEPILFYTEQPGEKHDLILELYNTNEYHDRVIDFFTRICGSREISKTILFYADMNDVPPALAFALAWEESRFKTHAVNSQNRNGSIDRGLFQLNSNSFPDIDAHDFFNPDLSARYGISHLRFCLDFGGTEIAALAMYNAGTGRVRSTGTPKSTLDYVHRILQNRQRIETQFNARFVNRVAVPN